MPLMHWRRGLQLWLFHRCSCSPIIARSNCAAILPPAGLMSGRAPAAGIDVQLSLNRSNLTAYVGRQLENLFPDGFALDDLPVFVDRALERLEYCFSRVRLKGY